MHHLAKRVDSNHDAVEIGSYHGRSIIAIASGFANPNSRLWAVDPHSGDITQAKAGLRVDSWDAFQSNINKTPYSNSINPVRTISIEAAQ